MKEPTTIILNDCKYHWNCYIATADGRVLPLNKAAVKSLIIEENIIQPFYSGWITLNNIHDVIENTRIEASQLNQYGFALRNDGRDVLYLSLSPELNEGETANDQVLSESNTDPRKYTKLEIIGVLINEKPEIDKLSGFKYVTYEFIHPLMYRLMEKKNTRSYNGIISDNIRQILLDELGDVISQKWETNSASINFSPPFNYRLMTCLEYLLRYDYLKKGELESYKSLLNYNRHSNVFEYQSLDTLFSNITNNDYLLESFYIGRSNNFTKFKPLNGAAATNFNSSSLLTNFSLTNISGEQALEAFNNYDAVTKPFLSKGFIQSPLRINELRDKFSQTILQSVKSVYPNAAPYIALNDTRKTDSIKTVIFEQQEYPYITKDVIVASMFSNLLFYQLVMNYQVTGQTYRTSGMFIDVLKGNELGASYFDYKINGRWLISRVRHVIVNDNYVTDIECVKPYLTDPIKFNEEVK